MELPLEWTERTGECKKWINEREDSKWRGFIFDTLMERIHLDVLCIPSMDTNRSSMQLLVQFTYTIN